MIYVSSDWHGCPLSTIQALLEQANFDENNDFLFVLGDVIDRGEHSVELLKFLMNSPSAELLLGNHEAFMLANAWIFDEVTDKSIADLDINKLSMLNNWQSNGGNYTIEALYRETPETRADILDYIRECPLYDSVSVGDRDFLLVHGGLENYSPDKKIRDYTQDELLWCRPTLNTRFSKDFTTIIGHTPVHFYGSYYKGKILKTSTWINIDTGAAEGLTPCLLRLDDMQEFYL